MGQYLFQLAFPHQIVFSVGHDDQTGSHLLRKGFGRRRRRNTVFRAVDHAQLRPILPEDLKYIMGPQVLQKGRRQSDLPHIIVVRDKISLTAKILFRPVL